MPLWKGSQGNIIGAETLPNYHICQMAAYFLCRTFEHLRLPKQSTSLHVESNLSTNE